MVGRLCCRESHCARQSFLPRASLVPRQVRGPTPDRTELAVVPSSQHSELLVCAGDGLRDLYWSTHRQHSALLTGGDCNVFGVFHVSLFACEFRDGGTASGKLATHSVKGFSDRYLPPGCGCDGSGCSRHELFSDVVSRTLRTHQSSFCGR